MLPLESGEICFEELEVDVDKLELGGDKLLSCKERLWLNDERVWEGGQRKDQLGWLAWARDVTCWLSPLGWGVWPHMHGHIDWAIVLAREGLQSLAAFREIVLSVLGDNLDRAGVSGIERATTVTPLRFR